MTGDASAPDWGFRHLDEQTARSNFALWISDLERRSWFRRVVAERGGPSARSLNASPASLGPLGAWLLTSLRADAQVPAPSPGFLDRLFSRKPARRDAPPWAGPDLPPPFDALSDEALRLIDEAAAYLKTCYRERFPHSHCSLDTDAASPTFHEPLVIGPADVTASPVRMVLEAVEPLLRDTVSVDDWLLELLDGWSARVPEAMRDPPRGVEWAYQQLSRKGAQAHFDWYVATEAERLEAFRELVERLGGPRRADLDLSRDSMRPLGAWMLGAVADGPRDGDIPLWAQPMPAHQLALSGDGIRLMDGVATYFAAAVHLRHHALTWALNKTSFDVNYQTPNLGNLMPTRPMLVGLDRGRSAEPPDGDWLVRIFDPWDQAAERADTRETQDEPAVDDVEVERTDEPGFDVEIWIPESVEPLIGAEAFEALEARFAAIPGIRTLIWEDRELLYAKLERGTRVEELRDQIKAILRDSQAG
jgi:hypothetical protein